MLSTVHVAPLKGHCSLSHCVDICVRLTLVQQSYKPLEPLGDAIGQSVEGQQTIFTSCFRFSPIEQLMEKTKR